MYSKKAHVNCFIWEMAYHSKVDVCSDQYVATYGLINIRCFPRRIQWSLENSNYSTQYQNLSYILDHEEDLIMNNLKCELFCMAYNIVSKL